MWVRQTVIVPADGFIRSASCLFATDRRMAENYKVQQGDCIFSIAFEKGFFADTIWSHSNNKELNEARKDPNVLMPGDVVHVPDKRLKELNKPTNEVHKFRVKNTPKTFRIQIMRADVPVRDMEYVLAVDGVESTGKTSNEGWIRASILPDAKKAKLSLKEGQKFELDLGHLNPVDEVSGAQGRLKSMGYYKGSLDGDLDDETKDALKTFQASNDIDVTGELDDKTRSALTDQALN